VKRSSSGRSSKSSDIAAMEEFKEREENGDGLASMRSHLNRFRLQAKMRPVQIRVVLPHPKPAAGEDVARAGVSGV
jgi:hypothetical protein